MCDFADTRIGRWCKKDKGGGTSGEAESGSKIELVDKKRGRAFQLRN